MSSFTTLKSDPICKDDTFTLNQNTCLCEKKQTNDTMILSGYALSSGNKKVSKMLIVKLFLNNQILLCNKALINLSHHQQIRNPLNLSNQVFLHSSQSSDFLMQL